MSDFDVRLQALHLHPVKSCAGIAVPQARLVDTGFEFDRAWMVVDEDGEFLSQRELPRMQLIRQRLRGDDLVLRAPGMLALHLALDRVEAPCRVRIWRDTVRACDMGPVAAQWFTDFLGRPARLARFDPAQRRLADRAWTGALAAPTAFADGFPLLVVSTASLAELNRRLALAGHAPAAAERFRPNLVVDGLPDAHGEDFLDELVFDAETGPVVLKLVKPCTRCGIPDIDPTTAETGHAVSDTLAGYRADARLDGALTFGMNAVIVSGVGQMLRVGMAGRASIRF